MLKTSLVDVNPGEEKESDGYSGNNKLNRNVSGGIGVLAQLKKAQERDDQGRQKLGWYASRTKFSKIFP